MVSGPRVVVALDFSDRKQLDEFVAKLDPGLCRLKVGKELFTTFGPAIVEQLQVRGFEVFLDLKFHDIPNTTAQAVKAAAGLGVWMVNVHASGGRRMMEACREVLEQGSHALLLIAVTMLTSLSDEEIVEIGFPCSAQEMVGRLAGLAQSSGMDGVVCSAQEAPLLRRAHGEEFCLVTPGIRPAAAAADDQTRIVTPAQAILDGSSYLVVGRPVTRALNPLDALQQIVKEIESV